MTMREVIRSHNGDLARVSSHPVGVFLTSAVAGEHVVQDFDPAQARALAAAILRAADEAEGRTAHSGWFADLTDEDERNTEYPWQPFFQHSPCCMPLPIWFATEEQCNAYIRDELAGRGFLPGEGK